MSKSKKGKIEIIRPKEIQHKKDFINFIDNKKYYSIDEYHYLYKKISFISLQKIGYVRFNENNIEIYVSEDNIEYIKEIAEEFIENYNIIIKIKLEEDDYY